LNAMILLVDDEPDMLTLIRRIMHELAGDYYDLVAVPDGATALALLTERPAALVITDYHMPNMDGVRLTEAIKADAPQCLVVVMSADLDVQRRAKQAGADFFVSKPFRFPELTSIVQAALAQ
jgi:two-component system chemotaxis response regulator CheY